MKIKVLFIFLTLLGMLTITATGFADNFTVSTEFKNIQDIWTEEYSAEFPVDETTTAQPALTSLADLRYEFSALDQQTIFTALLAINSQAGNLKTAKLLADCGFKNETSDDNFINIYSRSTSKQLQLYVVFQNLLPQNLARFAADCGTPVRYMDFDDAVHNYFSAVAEPAMQKNKLYNICQAAKADINVQITFCGTEFGGGFALIAGAIASRNFGILPQQLNVIQFSAPSIAGKGFADSIKGKLNVINFIRPNDPLALTLNSIDFYPVGNVVTVPCQYANVLDNSRLYQTVLNNVCANFITDVWNTEYPQAAFDATIIPLADIIPPPKANLTNINSQQYLFLGGLTVGAALAAYNDNYLPFANHLTKHDFNLTRFNGKGIYQTPTSATPVATFSVVYSKRLDTDGKHYYIIGIGVSSLDFLKRLDKDFIVESPAFGKMLKPVADDLNQLLKDPAFSSFVEQLKADKDSRVLLAGFGAGGSYAAYLAALIASDQKVEAGHIRLLTTGDWAAISPEMQTLLTQKVKAYQVTNYRDVIPQLGEFASNTTVLQLPLFMPQNGDLVSLPPGYIANYTLAEHSYKKYFGIILKNSHDYIHRWNEEIWLRQQAKLDNEIKQTEIKSNDRMICVTGPCDPW
ncbi:MAG: hypothetical protein WCV63_08500 [Negativicutes bacterium]|jgi:hypothetical protein